MESRFALGSGDIELWRCISFPGPGNAHRKGINLQTNDRKNSWKKRYRRQNRQDDDQHTAHAHRAQHRDAKERESKEADGNGQSRKGHGPPCDSNGKDNSILDASTMRKLFTKTANHEER